MKNIIKQITLLVTLIIGLSITEQNNAMGSPSMSEGVSLVSPLSCNKQLLDAIRDNDLYSAQSAIEQGADVNDDGEIIPIFYAVLLNRLEIAQLLIHNNAEISNDTILCHHDEDPTKKKYLAQPYLDYLAPHNSLSKLIFDSITPLELSLNLYAFGHNNESMIQLLLNNNATIDEDCVHDDLMSKGDFSSILELLLNRNIDINFIDENGMTPLYIASQYNRVQCATLLLDRGADIAVGIANDAATALHYAATYNSLDVARLLVQYGANVEAQDFTGNTPLHIAVNSNSLNVAKFLLECGTNTETVNLSNKTALELATEQRNVSIVNMLIKHKLSQVGYQPLHQHNPQLANYIKSTAYSPVIQERLNAYVKARQMQVVHSPNESQRPLAPCFARMIADRAVPTFDPIVAEELGYNIRQSESEAKKNFDEKISQQSAAGQQMLATNNKRPHDDDDSDYQTDAKHRKIENPNSDSDGYLNF